MGVPAARAFDKRGPAPAALTAVASPPATAIGVCIRKNLPASAESSSPSPAGPDSDKGNPRPGSLESSPAPAGSDKKGQGSMPSAATAISQRPRTAEQSPKEKSCSPGIQDRKKGPSICGLESVPWCCLLCAREASARDCDRCASRLKVSLLEADLDAAARPVTGKEKLKLSYCPQCGSLVTGAHEEHQGRIIPLHKHLNCWTAWDSGEESWSALFQGIQADKRVYWHPEVARPFLIKPLAGTRCEVCSDHVAPPTLYGTLVRFCTIDCWLSGDGGAAHLDWAAALVRHDFSEARADAFCFDCACGFLRGTSSHDGHDVLHVKTDLPGKTPCIDIPADHPVASALDTVKDGTGGEIHSSETRRLRIKNQGARRCRSCNVRLVDGDGEACSLVCALPPRRFLPRPLRLQKK